MTIKCYVDSNGWRRAECFPANTVLAGFLESDVQSFVDTCDAILGGLNAVQQKQLPRYEFAGNAYFARLDSAHVFIECQWSTETRRVSHEIFKTALLSWRDFLLKLA